MTDDQDETLLSASEEDKTVDEIHQNSDEEHPPKDTGVDSSADGQPSEDAASLAQTVSSARHALRERPPHGGRHVWTDHATTTRQIFG